MKNEEILDPRDGKYLVPRGSGEGHPIILDMAAVAAAESRLRDVANVNVQTAPEMLATFNHHWLTLRKGITALTYERNQAENCWKRTKAEALLGCTEEVLATRGHKKASADIRDAFVELDKDVINAKDRFDQIRTVLDYLSGKADGFLNAYNSVKKICGTSTLPTEPLGDPGNRDVYADKAPGETAEEPEPEEEEEIDMPEGFEDPGTYSRSRR